MTYNILIPLTKCLLEISWVEGQSENTGLKLTLVSPGIIQVEEYRNQNIQHITTLQDKKQELLSWEHTRDFVE